MCRESPAGDRGHSSGDRLWKAVGGPAFGLCPFENTWEGVVVPQTLAFFCRRQIRNQRVSGRTTRSGGCGGDSAVPALRPVLLRSPAVSAVPGGACDCSPRCPPGHRGAPSLPAGELPWPRVAPGPANRPFTEPRHFPRSRAEVGKLRQREGPQPTCESLSAKFRSWPQPSVLIKGRRKATLRARGLGGAPGSLPSAVVDLLCAVIRVQGAGVWQGRTRVQVRALSRLRSRNNLRRDGGCCRGGCCVLRLWSPDGSGCSWRMAASESRTSLRLLCCGCH